MYNMCVFLCRTWQCITGGKQDSDASAACIKIPTFCKEHHCHPFFPSNPTLPRQPKNSFVARRLYDLVKPFTLLDQMQHIKHFQLPRCNSKPCSVVTSSIATSIRTLRFHVPLAIAWPPASLSSYTARATAN